MKNSNQKTLLILLLCFTLCITLSAQQKRLYKAWIYTGKSKSHYMGALYAIDKEQVMIMSTWDHNEIMAGNFRIDTFKVEDIRMIKLRRDGKVLASALFGSVVGVTAGFVLTDFGNNFVSQDEQADGTDTIAFGIIGGAFYGSLIGLIRKTYHIDGRTSQYLKNYKNLEKKTFLKMTGQL